MTFPSIDPGPASSGSRAVCILRAVHAQPGITRARLVRSLGISSGLATDTIARLVERRLLDERPAPETHRRGRPSRCLGSHAEGPLAAIVVISHEQWEVALVALGGDTVQAWEGTHDRRLEAVIAGVADALEVACRQGGQRVRALSVSLPGTVSGTRLIEAPNVGWREVDLERLRPPQAAHVALLAGNDATFSALAESRHGAAVGAESSLHLFMHSGVGGALLDGGRVIGGARGMSGEFGHLPFGPPDARCRCGALGCWNTVLDGAALARQLDREPPADEVTFIRSVIAAARAGNAPEQRVVRETARALGRGAAGLVNALDPDRVTLGGLAVELMELHSGEMRSAYRDGLMSTIARRPPALTLGALGDRAPLIGAADHAFDTILTDSALASWRPA